MCKGLDNVQRTCNVPDQAVSDAGKKRHGQLSLGPNRIYAIWASKVFPVRNCQWYPNVGPDCRSALQTCSRWRCRGPHQPDIRPRGEMKKPRRPDPMPPQPLCNAWSLRAYSVIDIRIRNWHVCETFRMIWRPENDRGFSFSIICIFGCCINSLWLQEIIGHKHEN